MVQFESDIVSRSNSIKDYIQLIDTYRILLRVSIFLSKIQLDLTCRYAK